MKRDREVTNQDTDFQSKVGGTAREVPHDCGESGATRPQHHQSPLVKRHEHPFWEWGVRNMKGSLSAEVHLKISHDEIDNLRRCQLVDVNHEYCGAVGNVSMTTDCADSADRLPIVNSTFKNAVEATITDDVQFIPVLLKSQGGEHQWWIVNVLQKIDCIDLAQTLAAEGVEAGPPFLDIIVDATKIAPRINVFRVKNHIGAVFMSNRVRQLILKSKLRIPYISPLRCTGVAEG